ncbi:MAG: hypothetical protein LPK80_08325 [Bacteroidota bacterium]|nr:hypothetical protein [Bacteroidota bacterium]MDX5448360.1 hypothetical protein [Bacteroidota bacterium]
MIEFADFGVNKAEVVRLRPMYQALSLKLLFTYETLGLDVPPYLCFLLEGQGSVTEINENDFGVTVTCPLSWNGPIQTRDILRSLKMGLVALVEQGYLDEKTEVNILRIMEDEDILIPAVSTRKGDWLKFKMLNTSIEYFLLDGQNKISLRESDYPSYTFVNYLFRKKRETKKQIIISDNSGEINYVINKENFEMEIILTPKEMSMSDLMDFNQFLNNTLWPDQENKKWGVKMLQIAGRRI